MEEQKRSLSVDKLRKNAETIMEINKKQEMKETIKNQGLEKECLTLLYKNNSIDEDSFNYLISILDKTDIISEMITVITVRNISYAKIEAPSKEIQISNLKSTIKRKILKLVDQYTLKIPEKNYYEMAENKATNSITKVLVRKHKESDFDIMGNIEIKSDKTTIKLNGVKTPKTSTSKFLDFLMLMWVENGRSEKTIKVHLKEYLNLRGKKDTKDTRKELRKEINEALNTIENIKITFTTERGQEKLNIKLNGGTCGIYNSIIHFNFNADFTEYLKEIPNQFMYAPKELFTFNDKYNPHSYYLLRKICLHKRLNLTKNNENIIGVKTLLDYCPKFEAYKNYNKSNHKRFLQLILEPFEKDMDAINSFNWHYKGNTQNTFDEFIKENVIITWNDYPVEKIIKLNSKKKEKKVNKK
jgi:hypothetical protein